MNNKKIRKGRVLSNKMDKTIIVEEKRRFLHPLYKKLVEKKVKYVAHDENNKAEIGDFVTIIETRPLSATKRWRIKEISGKGE